VVRRKWRWRKRRLKDAFDDSRRQTSAPDRELEHVRNHVCPETSVARRTTKPLSADPAGTPSIPIERTGQTPGSIDSNGAISIRESTGELGSSRVPVVAEMEPPLAQRALHVFVERDAHHFHGQVAVRVHHVLGDFGADLSERGFARAEIDHRMIRGDGAVDHHDLAVRVPAIDTHVPVGIGTGGGAASSEEDGEREKRKAFESAHGLLLFVL